MVKLTILSYNRHNCGNDKLGLDVKFSGLCAYSCRVWNFRQQITIIQVITNTAPKHIPNRTKGCISEMFCFSFVVIESSTKADYADYEDEEADEGDEDGVEE